MRTAKIGPDLRLSICPWVYQTLNEDDVNTFSLLKVISS